MRNSRLSILATILSMIAIFPARAAEGQPPRPEPAVVSATVPYSPPADDAAVAASDATPKNVILLIGDGMGFAAVAAGRAATVGPAGTTHMDTMPVTGMVKTHSANDAVTDSAASGTAIASGKKTLNGAIGVTPDEQPVETVREWASARGKATGVVTTERITGATPAAFYAKVLKRGQTADIAAQVPGSSVDLFVGGGMGAFSEEREGTTQRAEAEKNGFLVVETLDALNEAIANDQPILALLAKDALPPSVERDYTLSAIVKAAIAKLSHDEDGFFLIVEGAQIDWAAHDNHAQHLVNEFADFDMAVGEALQFAGARNDTLVIVTADHETGGITLPKAPDVTVGRRGEDGYTPAAGVAFSSGSHTGIMVPLFAAGAGANAFGGVRDNTEIAPAIRALWDAHD